MECPLWSVAFRVAGQKNPLTVKSAGGTPATLKLSKSRTTTQKFHLSRSLKFTSPHMTLQLSTNKEMTLVNGTDLSFSITMTHRRIKHSRPLKLLLNTSAILL